MDIIKNTKNKLVVVEIGTEKSEACQYLNPGLENTAKRFGDQVIILRIDFMTVPEVFWELPCPEVPTVIVFKNGRIVDSIVSTVEWEVDDMIQKNLDMEAPKVNEDVL